MLKDTSKCIFAVLLQAVIESNLFIFIVILALPILGSNAVERARVEFENITLIQLLV